MCLSVFAPKWKPKKGSLHGGQINLSLRYSWLLTVGLYVKKLVRSTVGKLIPAFIWGSSEFLNSKHWQLRQLNYMLHQLGLPFSTAGTEKVISKTQICRRRTPEELNPLLFGRVKLHHAVVWTKLSFSFFFFFCISLLNKAFRNITRQNRKTKAHLKNYTCILMKRHWNEKISRKFNEENAAANR